jgi:hypothetical protein
MPLIPFEYISNMVVYDEWEAENGCHAQGKEVGDNVADWPTPAEGKSLTLRLGEVAPFDVEKRRQSQARDVIRLQAAQDRADVTHLEVHYTCVDKLVISALVELLTCDQREWQSFTLKGVNEMGDFFASPIAMEDFGPVFEALRNVKSLNIYSCTLSRGRGLEGILKRIQNMPRLSELRLRGWQIDGVSMEKLLSSLQIQTGNTFKLLSLRSCYFAEIETFEGLVDGLKCLSHIKTLNLSYCELGDSEVSYLASALRTFSSLQCLHIGGNECMSMNSVDALASWIRSTTTLRDLNLRGLWIGFSQGQVQRLVDLSSLFDSLNDNSSLRVFTLSENYLTSIDLKKLSASLEGNSTLKVLDLSHNQFEEEGANAVLQIVKRSPSLEAVRFDNHLCRYRCSDEIKMNAHLNWVNYRLLQPKDIFTTIWPKALARIQEKCDDRHHARDCLPDVLFHLLRFPSGESGTPLVVSAAMSMSYV